MITASVDEKALIQENKKLTQKDVIQLMDAVNLFRNYVKFCPDFKI